jgi:uncharacterized protein YndB with AHSA1/START domain
MSTNDASAAGAAAFEFVIAREYAAPRELVFRLWSECQHLSQWFGPRGFTMPHCDNDLQPGGRLHYQLAAPDGTRLWGRWVYRVITPPERLEFIASFSDQAGGVTRHPFSAEWPLMMLSTIQFTEQAGRTTVTVRASALEATPGEQQAFSDGAASMQQGWGGTLEQFEEYLKRMTQTLGG